MKAKELLKYIKKLDNIKDQEDLMIKNYLICKEALNQEEKKVLEVYYETNNTIPDAAAKLRCASSTIIRYQRKIEEKFNYMLN